MNILTTIALILMLILLSITILIAISFLLFIYSPWIIKKLSRRKTNHHP